MKIRFGTSGWRAIIAEDFTFDNVKRVTEAICRYLKTETDLADKPLIIGHDSRFMGEQFASAAADIAAKKGFKILKCNGPVPTPTISHAVRHLNAAGALNFTASHNPPEYQGIKFSTFDGAPALPEITKIIEANVEAGLTAENAAGGTIEELDPRDAYLEDLKTKINFKAIAAAGGKYAYDALYGTGRGYLDKCLLDIGLQVDTLNDWRDVTFGGRSPEPGTKQLEGLAEKVVKENLTLGIATDGDGDRFGIIDSSGDFITANDLLALLADYMAESRGWNLGFARSVATSHMIDRVAEHHGVKLYETPVGFKYIGELINKDEITLGGEESAGLSIRGHYPEKDGILACLLAVEAVAVRGKSLSEQLNELYEKVGRLYSGRIGVKLNDEIAAGLKTKLDREIAEIGRRKVENINRLDGVKYIFADKSWILMRPSGTEPLVRIYAESDSAETTNELLKAGEELLMKG